MAPGDDTLRSADALATELARAAALTRVASGVAHALAEAFRALLSETQLLEDARKADPEVAETCFAIRSGVGRCAAIARLLADQRSIAAGAALGASAGAAAGPGGADVRPPLDLGRVLSGAEPLLELALSRRSTLVLEEPDERLLARGDPAAVESLLVLVALHAESMVANGPARLALRALGSDADETVAIEVTVSGDALAAGAERSLAGAPGMGRDASDAAAEVGGLTLLALHGVADAQRARLEIERAGDALKLRAVFPSLEDPP